MTADINPKILARIKKLLTLAENAGATEGERDNAMRMAHATLAKYNLDLASVQNSDAKKGSTIEDRVGHPAESLGFLWARQVAVQVAELFFCSMIYVRLNKTSDKVRYTFIGRASNATTSAILTEFLTRAIYNESLRRMKADSESWSWQRSFCWGATMNIRERVKKLKEHNDALDNEVSLLEHTPDKQPGTALVLASVYASEQKANAQFLEKNFNVKEGKKRDVKAIEHNAYHEGHAYGNGLSLAPQLGNKGQ